MSECECGAGKVKDCAHADWCPASALPQVAPPTQVEHRHAAESARVGIRLGDFDLSEGAIVLTRAVCGEAYVLRNGKFVKVKVLEFSVTADISGTELNLVLRGKTSDLYPAMAPNPEIDFEGTRVIGRSEPERDDSEFAGAEDFGDVDDEIVGYHELDDYREPEDLDEEINYGCPF